MPNKTVDSFVQALVNSDQELYTWPADWSKTPEQYVPPEDQEQSEAEKD